MENTLLVSNVCRLIRLHLTVRRPETDVKNSGKAKLIVHLIFANSFEITGACVWNLFWSLFYASCEFNYRLELQRQQYYYRPQT